MTQEEMCAGVITESFYSRVENGKSEIGISDLLLILAKHKIALNDFFAVFDKQIQGDLQQRRILRAFNNRDFVWLKKQNFKNLILNSEIELIQRTLNRGAQNKSIEFKVDPLQVGNWNKVNLWKLAISMSLYNTEEVDTLIASIREKNDQIDMNDQKTLEALVNVMINYIDRCYSNKDETKMQQAIQFVQEMPNHPVIMFHKLVVEYYSCLIKRDIDYAQSILAILKETGYCQYVAWLPKL